MKKISFVKKSNGSHWVGDGFPVRNIFSYTDIAEEISPFLMMDYAGPTVFQPTTHRRGVGEHPHRGFETVTIVYSGEVEHRDSHGGGGIIGPGEVQWMTAASGLIHEEFHSSEYAKRGGPFEMIQLWVNLPKKDKMTNPKYQAMTKDRIPEIELPDSSGIVRIIAGKFHGQTGPASTFTPMNIWDVRMKQNSSHVFTVEENQTTSVFVLSGEIKTSDGTIVREAELGVFETSKDQFQIQTNQDSKLLFLIGTPLNEPVVGYGPFVMNTKDEIRQAMMDYQTGKLR